ncbi:uncharacterized protein [Typha angustifolia]|uniref:uncharacterized protein isoform X2 n=1 Tax=Typha angustifolia TaxID=59011 RepID=UPI003C2ABCFF
MADRPSRALVVYGDGHASLVSPSHTNLHSVASRASCGFLSLRTPPPEETEDDRAVRELAQLLDAFDFYTATTEQHSQANAVVGVKESSIPRISERFMGLRAAVFSSCTGVRSFAANLGFSVFKIDGLIEKSDSSEELQRTTDELQMATELLRLLGFSGGDVLENFEFDIVFLHITMEKAKSQKGTIVGRTDVDWLDKLVGGIVQVSQPELAIASRLHLSIILSYGTVSETDELFSLISNSSTETNSDLSLYRPPQSYTMKGGNPLKDVRHHHPMLFAQWQDGVTRRDMAKTFSFDEFIKHGGNLAILADRFLHEVAFKLWKAPKYGA